MTAGHSLEDRLLASRRDRKEVKALLGQAVLHGKPEAEINSLQEELTLHEKSIARFQAAIDAKASENVEQHLADRKASVAAARAVIAKADEQIEQMTAQMLAHIEQLGPLVAQLQETAASRNAALRSALKAGLDVAAWDRVVQAGGVITPLPVVGSTIATALFNAGVRDLGVHLDLTSRRDPTELAANLRRVKERTEACLVKADRALAVAAYVDADEEDF